MRISSRPTSRRCCRSRGASCFWKRATSPRSGAVGQRRRSRGHSRGTRGARERSARRRGRARPVPALHAQGDPRAAARHRPDARGARRRRQVLDAAFGPAAPKCSSGSRRCTSPPAARVFTRASSPAISSSSICRIPAGSRSPASTATAIRSSRRTRCSSRFPSPARRRTRWRRCATPARRGISRPLASATSPESSMVRESNLVLLTRAGPEIGVASTKAFTTQLTALGMLMVALAKHRADGAAGSASYVAAAAAAGRWSRRRWRSMRRVRAVAEIFVESITRFRGPRTHCPPSPWRAR